MPSRRVAAKPPTVPSPSPSSSSVDAPPANLATSVKHAAAQQGQGLVAAVGSLWHNYRTQTAPKLKLIDCFMLFLVLTGVIQFVYCFAVTNFPFNAFIGGFAAAVGQFVLLGALRIQSNPANKATFPSLSPERAFGDFLFGSLILHFFVWNYLG
ncbi:defender against cell death 1 [Rhodotorula diobovata]|uniref:Dolichyl-diphosphooligosaccharide--protein glycosyltransferase subunit OST2 n=1 Tax=Rhodotorula diobovata TaxID=5288 RepID=A0A5C5G6J0_9BASI|nr:defender against cell death 1 [Rhodotorula diobovata]